ncbi:MAG: hypothetical protein ACTTKL_08400 [Treponema sp.]
MTPALLLHQTQELLLLSEQRRILSCLNARRAEFYPVYPLWCFIRGEKLGSASSAELKRRITSVEIKSPVRDAENLIFPVGIGLIEGIYIEEKIVFAVRARQTYDGNCDEREGAFPEAASGVFPIACRIFQAAEVQREGAQFEAFNAVWVKHENISAR